MLQLLYYLRLQNFDEALVRLEHLRKYKLRHRHHDSAQRCLFLRLLRELADTGFDPAKICQHGLATLETLIHTPPPNDGVGGVEIIPYEHL